MADRQDERITRRFQVLDSMNGLDLAHRKYSESAQRDPVQPVALERQRVPQNVTNRENGAGIKLRMRTFVWCFGRRHS
ncbi:MAG: hypothetical protein ACTSYE_04200 [Alphaproteobacteria bacterium]